jgi:hypothetical protein
VSDKTPIIPEIGARLHIPRTLERAHFQGYWLSTEIKEAELKWQNYIKIFLHDEDTEQVQRVVQHIRSLWQHVRTPRTALDNTSKVSKSQQTKHHPKQMLAKRRGSKKSTKPTIFSSSVSEDTSPISLTHMREVDVTDFETQHKPNSAHSTNLDPDYSILQPMTLNVPNFDPASYGHHHVKGNGSCLVNVCAYALLGTESKSASLRDSIVRFVQDCNQELFSMRSVCCEIQNLTMEILDGMADEESVESPFFISKVNDYLGYDLQLNVN